MFEFSPEHQAIRDAARRFARERLAPGYRERETAAVLDRALAREMGALGLLGPELPERFGGAAADRVTTGIIHEEVGAGDFNVGYLPLLASLCGDIIASHAPRALADRWLPGIVSGEVLPALALTEPQGGSDAARLKLRARRDGDDWTLDGEKTSISLADQADVAVVFARSGEAGAGAHGITAFLVELDAKGITRTRFEDCGQAAAGRGSLFLDGVRVPDASRLGDEGQGFRQVMQGFDFSRALIALQCLGLARQSLEETWQWVEGRHAFGQPLGSFQGVSFPLVEFETQVEAARLLCYRTLSLKDSGQPHTAEAAMCKWWGPELAFRTIHACLLTHGHSGYSRDLPFEQRLRDVMGLEIGDGTAQIMKLIVARERQGAKRR